MGNFTFRRHGIGIAATVAMLWVVMGASAWAQVQNRPKPRPEASPRREVTPPQQGQRNYRYAPTLAILMVAYEGVLQNDEKTNPELVRAMKQSFERNPSGRRTMDRVYKAYRALSPSDREKIVGRALAQANGRTRLTQDLLEPILRRQFQLKPPPLAERVRATIDPASMKPVTVPDQEMQQDPEFKQSERPIPSRERHLGAEAKEGNSTRYRVEYKGLYDRQEPADPGFHCEPYVILTMKQGDNQWTHRKGPYERSDSGDKHRDAMTLRSDTPFGNNLDVVATVFEHDLGSIEDIEDAIQSGVDTLAGICDVWWDVPNWLKDAVTDVLTWFADLFSLDDDQIGEPQGIRFTRAYAERHTGHSTWEGFEYDTFLRCTGDMSGRRNQRGDFYVFLDVRPLD